MSLKPDEERADRSPHKTHFEETSMRLAEGGAGEKIPPPDKRERKG